jgi:hypothetical protein
VTHAVDRGKLKWDDRVVDLYPGFQLKDHPEALGIDEAVAGDDADRKAGRVVGLHRAADIRLEIRDQRRDARRHRPGRFGRLLGPRDIRQVHANHGGHQH